MALTPSDLRRRKMNLLMAMSYAAFASSKASAWSPTLLFAAGEQGAWYDPSDFSTMFQDSVGTTPVTAVEQPVGLLLDKSKGLALGSDGISGSYTGTATGVWAITATTVTRSGIAGSAIVNLPGIAALDANKTYLVSFTVAGLTGDSISFKLPSAGSNNGQISANGTYTYRVKAGGTTSEIQFIAWAGTTGTVTITNISVRELPGNHASQSTAASRPVLSARVNLLTYSENISVSPWSTLAQGTGVTPTRTANAGADPLGGNTATRLQLSRTGTGTGDRSGVNQTASSVSSGTDYVFSVFLKSYSGSTQKVVLFPNYGNGAGLEVTVTSAWQRFTVTANTLTGTTARVDISLGFVTSSETSADILVWGADLRVTNVGVNLPAYQRVGAATDYDTSGFPLYLKFDGVDDSLATGTIDFSATDKMSVFAGIRKLSDATGFGVIAELSGGTGQVGSFGVFAPATGATATYHAASARSSTSSLDMSTFTAPVTNVLTVSFNNAGASRALAILPRVNGVIPTISGGADLAPGAGAFGVWPLYIGRRNNVSLPYNGNLYSLIVRGALSTDAQIASTETWVNQRTGAY